MVPPSSQHSCDNGGDGAAAGRCTAAPARWWRRSPPVLKLGLVLQSYSARSTVETFPMPCALHRVWANTSATASRSSCQQPLASGSGLTLSPKERAILGNGAGGTNVPATPLRAVSRSQRSMDVPSACRSKRKTLDSIGLLALSTKSERCLRSSEAAPSPRPRSAELKSCGSSAEEFSGYLHHHPGCGHSATSSP